MQVKINFLNENIVYKMIKLQFFHKIYMIKNVNSNKIDKNKNLD